jgi:hypothetical protein
MVKCAKCGVKAATWCLQLTLIRTRELRPDEDSDDYDGDYKAPEHSIVRSFQCTKCFAVCSQRLPLGHGPEKHAVVVVNDSYKHYVNGAYGDRVGK